MRIEDISTQQLLLFASALCQPASEQYLTYAERVYCIEPQLDRVLLRPDFLRRLTRPPQSHYASLCGLHKILSAKIVHQVFVLLATEVGVRLNSLVVAGRDKLGHETWDRSILNLRAMHGAWLPFDIFANTFGHTLDVPKDGYSNDDYQIKWTSGQDKCEACILTRIGSDLDAVFDLQMVVLSRTRTRSKRKYREPRLTRIIEGWLKTWAQYYGTKEWQKKLEWNRMRADRLKQIRKTIIRERRQNRKLNGEVNDGEEQRRLEISAPMIKHEQQRSDAGNNRTRLGKFHECISDDTVDVPYSYDASQTGSHNLTTESDGDDDDEDDLGNTIRDTVYQAENDIIDCYEALISTPFLPDMSLEEHRERAGILDQEYASTHTEYDEISWPMVKNEVVKQQLARSKSTAQRRPSMYSESQYSQTLVSPRAAPYIPPRQQWGALSGLGRSSTIQERRASVGSWLTDSVPPSAALTPKDQSYRHDPRRARKSVYGFSPIEEEAASKYPSYRLDDDPPISPIRDAHTTNFENYTNANIDNVDSPVSPISTMSPTLSTTTSQNNGHSLYDPSSVKPAISSRLSRPFDGPVTDSNSVPNSVRRLRARDTAATDMTRWSSLYGGEVERIRRMESEQRDHSVPSRSKSEKTRRK